MKAQTTQQRQAVFDRLLSRPLCKPYGAHNDHLFVRLKMERGDDPVPYVGSPWGPPEVALWSDFGSEIDKAMKRTHDSLEKSAWTPKDDVSVERDQLCDHCPQLNRRLSCALNNLWSISQSEPKNNLSFDSISPDFEVRMILDINDVSSKVMTFGHQRDIKTLESASDLFRVLKNIEHPTHEVLKDALSESYDKMIWYRVKYAWLMTCDKVLALKRVSQFPRKLYVSSVISDGHHDHCHFLRRSRRNTCLKAIWTVILLGREDREQLVLPCPNRIFSSLLCRKEFLNFALWNNESYGSQRRKIVSATRRLIQRLLKIEVSEYEVPPYNVHQATSLQKESICICRLDEGTHAGAILKYIDERHHVRKTEELYREMIAYSALQHLQGTAIPEIIDMGRMCGRFAFLLMKPYVRITNWNEELAKGVRLAMAEIHKANFVHGSLKSDIFFQHLDSAKVVILDLGTAHLASSAAAIKAEKSELKFVLRKLLLKKGGKGSNPS